MPATMSLRDKNRAQYRQKVLATAKAIILQEGVKKLSLRYLATKAEVDPKTPANLFGNKAGIFLALLPEPLSEFLSEVQQKDSKNGLAMYFEFLETLHCVVLKNEKYYQELTWGLLSSREVTHGKGPKPEEEVFVKSLHNKLLGFLETMVTSEQLQKKAPLEAINKHNVIVHVSLATAWANGFIDFSMVYKHTKQSWRLSLLPYANEQTKRFLNNKDMLPVE